MKIQDFFKAKNHFFGLPGLWHMSEDNNDNNDNSIYFWNCVQDILTVRLKNILSVNYYHHPHFTDWETEVK